MADKTDKKSAFIFPSAIVFTTLILSLFFKPPHAYGQNSISYMDVHNHLVGSARLMNGDFIDDFQGAGKIALKIMVHLHFCCNKIGLTD